MKKIIYLLLFLSLVSAKEKFKKGNKSTGINLNDFRLSSFTFTKTNSSLLFDDETYSSQLIFNLYHSYFFYDHLNINVSGTGFLSTSVDGFKINTGLEYLIKSNESFYPILSTQLFYKNLETISYDWTGYSLTINGGMLYSINNFLSAKVVVHYTLTSDYDVKEFGQKVAEVEDNEFFINFFVQYDY